MKPPRQSRKIARRTLLSLGTAAGFVAVPKCFGCVVAYLGIGAALGLRPAVELCGAVSGSMTATVSGGLSALAICAAWRLRERALAR